MTAFILAGLPPFQPTPGLIFWSVLIFLLFWIIIGRSAFKPITKALKAREDQIQNALDEAKKAREEIASLKADNDRLFREAQAEKALIIKEAKETKDEILKEARTQAQVEGKRMINEAKELIENQKNAAMTEIKNEVGTMAIDIASKILQKDLGNDDSNKNFVKGLVNDLKLN